MRFWASSPRPRPLTRPARTLLILGLFGLAAVAALGVMARRYGAILESRVVDAGNRPARTAAAAESRIRAFVAVRERLADERGRSQERTDAERRERLARVLEHALESEGLARDEHDRIEGMVRGWERDGTAPPEPYRTPLARVREYLQEIESTPP